MEQDFNTQGEPETTTALRAYSGADPYRAIPMDLSDQRFEFTQERLSEALLAANAISAEQLSSAQQVIARSPGRRFMDIVLEKVEDQAAVQVVVARCTAMAFEDLDFDNVESVKQLEILGADYCLKHGVIPIRPFGSRLLLGVVHADDLIIVEEAQVKLGQSIKPVLVTPDDIAAAIDSYREGNAVSEEVAVDEIIGDIDEDDVEIVENEEEDIDLDKDQAGSSPVIRFVNYLIYNAVKEGASDIHIEPQEKKLQVRYRIDGVLFDAMNPPAHMKNAIVSRLKIMANLDIAERRVPQDGRIRAMVHGRKLDLRMSTLPMVSGEKVVLRILDTRSIQVQLDDLGMSEDMLQMWKGQIKQPHGIVLVTGPTGSGKTTTLYSSLNQMDRQKLNISTVEDPVEYHLGGINQTQTHESIGMSFAGALRALLRQDPDVIMVGEIRDGETSKIAIQASLTGHLVLSTLHTNDAPSAVTRLINIGVEPYLIGSALNAVVAQRLVRKICDHCKEQEPPDPHIAEHLAMQGVAIDEVWVGKGCDKCRNTGYSGRVGLYEMLLLNDQLRDRIAGNPNVTEFRRMCIEGGMVTLRQDGFQKVARGLTTVDEVLRVTEASV
ncbi:MAG: GspE/PulE family protein [Planctomycetota bacterium]